MVFDTNPQQPNLPLGSAANFQINQQTQTPAVPESVIKWRMDLNDVMKEIAEELKDLGNEKFQKHAMSVLKGIIHKSSIQANLDEETAREITLQVADDETEHIGIYYINYDMKPEDRDAYINIISVNLLTALSRAIDDWERKHTVDQSQERITTSQGLRQIFPLGYGAEPQQQSSKNIYL